jgi:hypothetical protein
LEFEELAKYKEIIEPSEDELHTIIDRNLLKANFDIYARNSTKGKKDVEPYLTEKSFKLLVSDMHLFSPQSIYSNFPLTLRICEFY